MREIAIMVLQQLDLDYGVTLVSGGASGNYEIVMWDKPAIAPFPALAWRLQTVAQGVEHGWSGSETQPQPRWLSRLKLSSDNAWPSCTQVSMVLANDDLDDRPRIFVARAKDTARTISSMSLQ